MELWKIVPNFGDYPGPDRRRRTLLSYARQAGVLSIVAFVIMFGWASNKAIGQFAQNPASARFMAPTQWSSISDDNAEKKAIRVLVGESYIIGVPSVTESERERVPSSFFVRGRPCAVPQHSVSALIQRIDCGRQREPGGYLLDSGRHLPVIANDITNNNARISSSLIGVDFELGGSMDEDIWALQIGQCSIGNDCGVSSGISGDSSDDPKTDRSNGQEASENGSPSLGAARQYRQLMYLVEGAALGAIFLIIFLNIK